MTHKCSEGTKCTCQTEVQSHNCMYRLRSPEEAMQDYKDNLAPPTEPVTSVPLELRPGYDSLSGRVPEDRISLPYVVDPIKEQYEKLPVIVDGEKRPPLTEQLTDQVTEPPVIGKFKAIPTERLDVIRQNHVDRARVIGLQTTGKAYHEIVEELLDYIEGVRAILNKGHL